MKRKTFTGSVWGILSPILLYFIMSMTFSAVLSMAAGIFVEDEHTMWLLTAVNLLMLPVYFWMYRTDRDWLYGKQGKRGMGAADVLLVLTASVCLSRGLNYLIALTPLPYYFTGYEAVGEIIYGSGLLSRVAATVISAPLLEELLMRGLIYNRLKLWTGKIKPSMIASAAVFGLFHGNVVQGIYAFGIGLLFAWLYEEYQNLAVPVLAHVAANGATLLFTAVPQLGNLYQNMVRYYLITALFLLAGAAAVKCIKISRRDRQRELYGRSKKYRKNDDIDR